jgi:hypothetical protein
VKSTVLIAVSGMSLLANLWLGWLTWRPAGEPPSAASVTPTARRIPPPAVTSAATRLPPGSVVEPPPDAFTLLTRLRDGRFPNSVLRAAANHLLLAHTPGLQQRLLIASPAFWREPPEGDAAMVATRAAAETELRKACDALLAELALPPDDNELAALALRFGPLPPDRARQLDALVRSMPEDRRRRELTQVLSPDELFECEVRSSLAARDLSDRLAAVEPTEDEFRALFRAWSSDPTLPSAGLIRVLGPERAGIFQRENDRNYRTTRRLADGLGLPAAAAAEAWQLAKDTARRARDQAADPTLPSVQRELSRSFLVQSLESDLRRRFGDAGAGLLQEMRAVWLDRELAAAMPPAQPR